MRGAEALKPNILVISGPTASGKSRIALALAESIGRSPLFAQLGIRGAEIINGDSVQLYRGFDIGSSKPAASDLARVPHHLLSVLDPSESVDAARFAALARSCIAELTERQVLPIVVGGSGLYLRSLLCGLATVPTPSADARALLSSREASWQGGGLSKDQICAKMHSWLGELDPLSAARLTPADQLRIRRALLVALTSGKSLAELQDEHSHSDRSLRALVWIIQPTRARLYQAIERRVDQMMEHGFLGEVESLRSKFGASAKPFEALGYRQLLQVLLASGENSSPSQAALEAAVSDVKRLTRNYAKRQFTWWRHQPEKLGWIDVTEPAAGTRLDEANLGERSISRFAEERLLEMLKNFLEPSMSASAPAAKTDAARRFSSDGIFFARVETE